MALALLALAAALLAGSAQTGRLAARSTQTHDAFIICDAESRTVLSELVNSWPSAFDSLRVGGASEFTVGPRRVGAGGWVATSRVRFMRVSGTRYVAGVESAVGPEGAVSARRRLSLIIERRLPSDTSTPPLPPVPIRRWSLADLF